MLTLNPYRNVRILKSMLINAQTIIKLHDFCNFMFRLECLGKSSTGPQKQSAAEVTSAHAETYKPNDNMGENKVTDKPRTLPAQLLRSVKVSCQETQKSGFPSVAVPDTDKFSPKKSTKITPRVGEHTQSATVPDDELKIKDLRSVEPPDSILTGGTTHSPPPAMPLTTHEPNVEEEQTEEEDVEDEDIKAPVQLIMKFLGAMMDRDYLLASKLCRMILIYEPDNPEASEFLPLIQGKLLEEAEQSTEEEEEEEDDDDDEDSGSDEESSQSSSCSSSSCSSSSSSDDDEEEKQENRHKPCPPSHVSP
ncbi:glutamate-rich protein 2 isoform X2 [Anarrhichthys ocellatus]|uniref:glutamate-rich protein 2 isoform X2 n=1 Tax=Anarrhichthys ocellatus TaxID=433405 RepID=UPI0012ECF318|nr:transcription initiation factor TFIID subunit 11-like isoform X2 [Anarrhichthys ocellatus]